MEWSASREVPLVEKTCVVEDAHSRRPEGESDAEALCSGDY